MTKLGFIGFGLIGASIAKALKVKKPGKYSVYVYDYHKDANPSLEKAVADGCIDSLRKDFDELFMCDAVFLCAPALKNIPYLSQLKEEAARKGKELPLITDVGSVKGNIVKAAEVPKRPVMKMPVKTCLRTHIIFLLRLREAPERIWSFLRKSWLIQGLCR